MRTSYGQKNIIAYCFGELFALIRLTVYNEINDNKR